MKKLYIIFLPFILTVCAFAQAANSFPETDYLDFAKMSDDNTQLCIDALKRNNWTTIYKSKSDIFKPYTNYVITFKLEASPESPDNAFLHLLVRKANTIHPENDILKRNIFASSKVQNIKVKFLTNSDPSAYAFQIHTRDSIKCKISEFKIEESTGDEFISFANKSQVKSYIPPIANLPSGAKEFEVDAPRNNGGIIVNGADFGIAEDATDIPNKINAALQYCKEKRAAKLLIKNGVYKITEPQTVNIIGMEDFVFDAQGSTFVYNKNRGDNFRIENCQRIEIKNINFDWDWLSNPLASVAEIVAIDKHSKNPYVDFKFYKYQKHPRHTLPLRVAMITPFDKKNKRLGYDGTHGLISVDQVTKPKDYCRTEWLSPNTIRVYDNKGGMIANLNLGNFERVQHYYYDMTCLNFISNKHVALKNINIYSCAGHAVLCSGTQEYWSMENVNIKPPASSDVETRPITTTADHIHFASSRGFFKMQSCEISFGADDCVNFHDCSSPMRKTSARKLTSITMRNSHMFTKGAQVQLRQSDFAPTNFKGTIKFQKNNPQNNNFEIEFESDLPEQLGDCFVVFNTSYDTRNIILRDCNFHDSSSNGLLILARDVTIENCRLSNNLLCALKLLTGYTYSSWCEGYGVDNIVVRNCRFERPNPTSKINSGKVSDIFAACYMRSDPSEEQSMAGVIKNVLIENCAFSGTNGLIAYIASAENFTARNNVFSINKKDTLDLPYRGGFFITHSQDVNIIGNTYQGNADLSKVGAYYDKSSVERLSVGQNKILKQ